MLSFYDEDDAVWLHPKAEKLKKDAVWRADHRPERRETGAYAMIVPGEQILPLAGGGLVRQIRRQEGGVGSRVVLINGSAVPTLQATAREDVKEYLAKVLDDAPAVAAAAMDDYLEEELLAQISLWEQKAIDAADEADEVDAEALRQVLRDVCVTCGWRALHPEDEILPESDDKEVSYLGSPRCVAHSLVMDSFFGRLDTGPRDEHDGDLTVYRAAISKGTAEYPGPKLWEELVLRRVPPLREHIEGTVDEEDRKAHLQVLKNLVKMLAVDHMWSSARPRRTITRPDLLVDSTQVCMRPPEELRERGVDSSRARRSARATHWSTRRLPRVECGQPF